MAVAAAPAGVVPSPHPTPHPLTSPPPPLAPSGCLQAVQSHPFSRAHAFVPALIHASQQAAAGAAGGGGSGGGGGGRAFEVQGKRLVRPADLPQVGRGGAGRAGV